jgi:hypothetical protein
MARKKPATTSGGNDIHTVSLDRLFGLTLVLDDDQRHNMVTAMKNPVIRYIIRRSAGPEHFATLANHRMPKLALACENQRLENAKHTGSVRSRYVCSQITACS